jgi:pantetheine-phosphate adenylyltransferase
MGTTAVVVPGSFDPITFGHMDLVERAASHFDHVVVAVLDNPAKSALFTVDQRKALIAACVQEFSHVEVDSFAGLLADYCLERRIGMVAHGIRAVRDFEYEQQLAQMNRRMRRLETVFLPSSPEHSHVSSSLAKETARQHGPLASMVPVPVTAALASKFS